MQHDDGYTHRHGIGLLGWLLGGILVLLVLGLFVAPLVWGGYYAMMGQTVTYPHVFFGWFFFPFGFIFFIFILFLVSRLLWFPWGRGYYYGRWRRYGGAEEILKERYARGEITKDQFDQMMRDLTQRG